ncbi:DUF2846 domain-containing protein [Luteibacter aegosomaticola]|uniref:DUF2846 domain-containing protein n=1 Tax=Luteibacter aegosomaticola TaxID=2911538 RepID=UPI001FF8A399|nr:DUF2846 domain-containing protein [Luteibacter aegosomaticola]UPG90898.1 DUF2846 domain-containing protein [Luteibacter aegosomaticola]
MKRTFFAAAALAVALLVSGCASVQKASEADSEHAKVFSPIADKAVLYIYRDESFGSAIKMPVSVDGVIVGETGPKSFLELAVAPGHHTIMSHTETNPTLDIDAEAGKAYYVWQEVKMGMWAARSLLHRMSDSEGKVGVDKCELLKTMAPAMKMNAAAAAPAVEAPARDAEPAPVAATAPATASATVAPPAPAEEPATAAATPAPVAEPAVAAAPAPADESTTAPATQPASGGIAALDDRVSKPMFDAAQDLASMHQCERLLHVRSIVGDEAHFYSACPGTSTPIEIACHAAACTEAAPHG